MVIIGIIVIKKFYEGATSSLSALSSTLCSPAATSGADIRMLHHVMSFSCRSQAAHLVFGSWGRHCLPALSLGNSCMSCDSVTTPLVLFHWRLRAGARTATSCFASSSRHRAIYADLHSLLGWRHDFGVLEITINWSSCTAVTLLASTVWDTNSRRGCVSTSNGVHA